MSQALPEQVGTQVAGADGEPAAHRLAALLEDAARGRFPPPDGRVEVLPPPPGRAMAVIGFSGHFVVASDAPENWVRDQLPEGDLLAPLGPRFLTALGHRLGRRDGGLDMLLTASGLAGQARLCEVESADHPRVLRAQAHREDVRAYQTTDGSATVALGRGLAQRWEVAIEVAPEARCRGVAREALIEARRLVGPSVVLFAQTAPANAASVRALLAAGYRPVGAEALFFDARAA